MKNSGIAKRDTPCQGRKIAAIQLSTVAPRTQCLAPSDSPDIAQRIPCCHVIQPAYATYIIHTRRAQELPRHPQVERLAIHPCGRLERSNISMRPTDVHRLTRLVLFVRDTRARHVLARVQTAANRWCFCHACADSVSNSDRLRLSLFQSIMSTLDTSVEPTISSVSNLGASNDIAGSQRISRLEFTAKPSARAVIFVEPT